MTRLEFGATTLCRYCAGSGHVSGRPCAACGGVGFSSPPPSNGDPNSDEAADAIAATAGKKRAEVLAAIVARGGATEREIEERMGIPARTVEELVNEARHDGAPILSDGDGYRLTDDPDEVATMAARLHRRSTHVHETASALDATAARMRTEAAARLEPSGTLWGQP